MVVNCQYSTVTRKRGVLPQSCQSLLMKKINSSSWQPLVVLLKKIALTEFSRPRSSGIIALNLRDEDELIGVDITDGSNEIMLFSSQGRVKCVSLKAQSVQWVV